MKKEKIHFYVDRDFGETFTASLKFLRQNFKLFFQCLLYIAGPFILLASIASAYYQATALQSVSLVRSGMFGSGQQYTAMYFVSIGMSIISQMALIGTVYSFMLTYHEKGPDNFTVSDVGRTLAKNIGNLFGTFFAIFAYVILAVIVLVGLGFIFGAVSSGLLALYVILVVIGLLIVGPPAFWIINSSYLVKMHEGVNAFFAIARTREVLKGSFWWTWVIVVCALIGVIIVSYVFLLPQIIYMMVQMFSTIRSENPDTDLSITYMVITTLGAFCVTLLYTILFIINGFHYFSLAERKDKKGLLQRIDDIGQKQDDNVQLHY